MVARTPRERELYEARIKMERDVIAKVEYAKTEGRQEGRIQLLQQLPGLPETPSNELAAMSLDQLSGLAIRLQAQLRDRR